MSTNTALSLPLLGLFTVFAAGCASIHSDRFYALTPSPLQPAASTATPSLLTTLHVSIPSMVDRNELVVRTPDGVKILEHERWAAPLADQITLVLGQDLERRREDLLIATGRAPVADMVKLIINADIVDLQSRPGGEIAMEVRWRIKTADGKSTVARDDFACPMRSADYASLSNALSNCVALLADKLIKAL
jgi:uncharacterized protein